jgi:hypothetical protein
VGREHTRLPAWALVPPAGPADPWRVWWRLDEDAERLAGTEHAIRLALRERVLTIGLRRRVLAPAPPRPGRHRLRIDALVPVTQSRDGHRTVVTRPTADTLRRACEGVAERLGVAVDWQALALADVACHTEACAVHVGGHWQRGSGDGPEDRRGTLRGWVGWVECTANAPAAWLLACAETLGLGGATALGLGRVKVTEVER